MRVGANMGRCTTMNGSKRNVQSLTTLAVLLGLLAWLALVGGCGGDKPAPQTDPTIEPGYDDGIETVPDTITPEDPTDGSGIGQETAPDYTAMQPAEFGVEDIYFGYDQYDLDDQAMATLARNARILRQHPEVVVLVEGHCDERGTIQYNLALGEKRARAVRDYLLTLGVAARNLRQTSYGESRPFVLGSNDAAWAKNRRAHFARP